jgi:DNA modification methylase
MKKMPTRSQGREPLRVEYLDNTELRPCQRNPRTHSKKQVHQIAAAIEQFGFINPVIIDSSRKILCGHGRLEASKLLGFDRIPTICIDHLNEAERRAYAIADNRLALNAGWDPEILRIEFQDLSEELDINFDLEITGFDTAEIDILMDGSQVESAHDPADLVPPTEPNAITQPGDIWVLGRHRVICADAREAASYKALMGNETARVVFTDPPYNVAIDGHVCGNGAIKHREFVMGSGEMTSSEFTGFLQRTLAHATHASVDGAIHFVCMDWRHMDELLAAGRAVYSERKNLCIWNKSNAGMGSFYRSKHELIFVFKCGSAAHVNTIELGKAGRYRSNVWDYAGVNTFGHGRMQDLATHPTVKPVAMVMDAIKDCSRRDEIVLDPFGGSGTTLVAAEKCRRRARLIELDPIYVDATIRRWERLSKGSAVHSLTGLTFEETRSEREAKPKLHLSDGKNKKEKSNED